jgi:branched-chain amino acid transport system substrate-binding protein
VSFKARIRVRPARAALAAVVAASLAVTVACGSSDSNDSGVGKPVAEVDPFPAHPAPAGGNGGATDVGVTATEIDTGSPIAASGPLPDAQLGTFLGVQAYYAMVNASGGIYGRKLKATRVETGFDANTGLSVCTEYIPKSFAFVGTQSNVDAVCRPLVQKSGIPWVGSWFDPQYYDLPNAWNPTSTAPYGTASSVVQDLYKTIAPDISKVAIIWVNTAGIEGFVPSGVAGWEHAGLKVVYNYGVPPDTVDMTPYVLEAKKKGADVVDAFAMDVTQTSRLAKAIYQQGWEPKLKTNYAVYDAKWHDLAGPGASEGWSTNTTYGTIPFFDSDAMNKTEGGKNFLYWWHKTTDKPLDNFAIEGWIHADAFVQGLIDAGPEITRAKLLTALNNLHDIDYGGLTAKYSDPGKQLLNCAVVVTTTKDGWKQTAPEGSGFGCTGETYQWLK